ncbi:hypothetical protein M0802_006861 [Mischocyttarus mexicanus]|nr:hypothetical protein M0802_006861 [Mischocyttarus mexicanus]
MYKIARIFLEERGRDSIRHRFDRGRFRKEDSKKEYGSNGPDRRKISIFTSCKAAGTRLQQQQGVPLTLLIYLLPPVFFGERGEHRAAESELNGTEENRTAKESSCYRGLNERMARATRPLLLGPEQDVGVIMSADT